MRHRVRGYKNTIMRRMKVGIVGLEYINATPAIQIN